MIYVIKNEDGSKVSFHETPVDGALSVKEARAYFEAETEAFHADMKNGVVNSLRLNAGTYALDGEMIAPVPDYDLMTDVEKKVCDDLNYMKVMPNGLPAPENLAGRNLGELRTEGLI